MNNYLKTLALAFTLTSFTFAGGTDPSSGQQPVDSQTYQQGQCDTLNDIYIAFSNRMTNQEVKELTTDNLKPGANYVNNIITLLNKVFNRYLTENNELRNSYNLLFNLNSNIMRQNESLSKYNVMLQKTNNDLCNKLKSLEQNLHNGIDTKEKELNAVESQPNDNITTSQQQIMQELNSNPSMPYNSGTQYSSQPTQYNTSYSYNPFGPVNDADLPKVDITPTNPFSLTENPAEELIESKPITTKSEVNGSDQLRSGNSNNHKLSEDDEKYLRRKAVIRSRARAYSKLYNDFLEGNITKEEYDQAYTELHNKIKNDKEFKITEY